MGPVSIFPLESQNSPSEQVPRVQGKGFGVSSAHAHCIPRRRLRGEPLHEGLRSPPRRLRLLTVGGCCCRGSAGGRGTLSEGDGGRVPGLTAVAAASFE